MIAIGTAIAWIVAVVVAVPLAIYCIEVLVGLWPARSTPAPVASPNTVVLIPAHDEAEIIGRTLTLLQEHRTQNVRVLVVADNCSDTTAEVARAHGADVIERTDPAHRGKGYALAAGRDHIASQPTQPDVVIVLDADCRLLPGSLARLAAAAIQYGAPVQAANLIEADLAAPPMVQISSFAMVVKNLYRSRGMQRLGGGALLTGTGMAFPWPLFASAALASGSIVEDLHLGIAMAEAGHTPRLVSEAHVRSAPAGMRDALAQRMRWEHGFLQTLRVRALPLLGRGIRRGSLAQCLLGLHLCVPPLALLLGIGGVVLAGLAAWAIVSHAAAPAALLAGFLAAALILTFAAWLAEGRTYLSPAALARVPLYLIWKIPLYARFLSKPLAGWNRTPRGPD